MYREHGDNVLSSRVRAVLGLLVNWRFLKLLYSHFFGVKINAFHFRESGQPVVKLMYYTTLTTILVIYLPLIVVNFVGLF